MYCHIVFQKVCSTSLHPTVYSYLTNFIYLSEHYKCFYFKVSFRLIYYLEFLGLISTAMCLLFLMLLDFFFCFVIFVCELIFNRKYLLLSPLVFLGLYRHLCWGLKGQFPPQQSLDYFSFPQYTCGLAKGIIFLAVDSFHPLQGWKPFPSHVLEFVGRVLAPIFMLGIEFQLPFYRCVLAPVFI